MRHGGSPRLGLAVATLALALAACTTGSDYQRPDVPLPAAWRGNVGDDAGLVNARWWQGFGDPALEALIDEAIDANQDLAVAAARVEQYAARLGASESARYPTVGYAIVGTRELRSQERPNGLRPGQSPTLSNFELGGNVSWELDLWGRVRRSNEAARAELLASQEARRGVMLTVVADVAAGYLKLLEIDQRLALVEDKLALRRKALALMDEKRKGGSATRLDVARLQSAVEEQAAALPEIRREMAVAEHTLAQLLGRPPGAIVRRSIDALTLPSLPAGVPADVLVRRPDVAAAEQALVAANARIGVAKTAYFPTLSLLGAIGLAADDLQWLFAETARTASLGAALAGTVFDGGRTAANVRESEAVRAEAQAQFVKSVQTALLEVENALATRALTDERETIGDRRVRALADVRDLTLARLEGGQAQRIELFNAEIDLRDAEIARLEYRRDRLLAMVGVYKAMGGGWMREEEQRRDAATPERQARALVPADSTEQAPK